MYLADVRSRENELLASITSTLGSVIKIDSTRKIAKKLSGKYAYNAHWVTNVGNEFGQILNSVLTTSEGNGLSNLASGLMDRYRDAEAPPPEVLYTDRDCCNDNVKELQVRLDVWHFMRRLSYCVTTEAHALFPQFMQSLSQAIFKWDPEDDQRLRKAKRNELLQQGVSLVTDEAISRAIRPTERALHCKRKTRGSEETIHLIDSLIENLKGPEGNDLLGVPLFNKMRIDEVWSSQRRHVECLQDPPDIALYLRTGARTKGGVRLPVYRCARGSTSLESFHSHLCRFIPGELFLLPFLSFIQHTFQSLFELDTCSVVYFQFS